jgi:hypothetical protein
MGCTIWFDYKNFLNFMRPSGPQGFPQGPPGPQGPQQGGYQPTDGTSDKKDFSTAILDQKKAPNKLVVD